MKIGIAGLGHLGKIHLKLLSELTEFKIAAIFDTNPQITGDLSKLYQVKACNTYDELLGLVEAVVIVTPTHSHYKLASTAIKQGKHVFIEKPSTFLAEETSELLKLSREAGVIVQVGHVERYNPAFVASREYVKSPFLIETDRQAFYNIRGTDVSVVMDLMIHDIDLVLNIAKSKVKHISATGKAIVSKEADIAIASIEFENGCVAKLSVNRISQHNIRKLDIYQDKTHIYIDLLNKTSTITDILPLNGATAGKTIIDTLDHSAKYEIHSFMPEVHVTNAIKMELSDFHKSISNEMPISVNLKEAEFALIVANQIEALLYSKTIITSL